jgi:hypothetical protein
MQLALALGEHHAERQEWDKARAALASTGSFDRAALDVRVRVHALLARVHARSAAATGAARSPLAAQEHAAVRALWSDPRTAQQAIDAAYPDEDEPRRMRRLARVLVAAGEAYFAAAEEKRLAEVAPLAFPAYDGQGDAAAVVAHVQTKVKEWSEKKRAAITKVEAEYVKILEIRPVPPPGSVVAAAARVGMMWADFADDVRRAPTPAAWKSSPAIRKAYVNALDAIVEPIRVTMAKPALEKCIALSARFQFRDEHTRDCEEWLAKNFKSEFHVVDEIIPALRPGTIAWAPPLMYDGTPRGF